MAINRNLIGFLSLVLVITALGTEPAAADSSSGDASIKNTLVAFCNVNLVPMTANIVLPKQTIIIENDRIVQIGPTKKIRIPNTATVIDGSGKYLLPGLADMHAHYLADYDRDSFFNLFLKNGITTVRLYQSFPNDPVLTWSADIKRRKLFGPTLFTCGLFFNDPAIPAESIVTAEKKYDFIKLYSYLTEAEFKATMRTAKKEKVYTIGHVPPLAGLDVVIAEGMNEIAHLTELDFDLVNYPKSEPLKNQLLGIIYNNWLQDFYSSPNQDDYLKKKEKNIDEIVTKVKNAGLFINTTLIVTRIINEQLFAKETFLKRPELPYMLKSFMPEYLAGKNAYQLMVNTLIEKNKSLTKGDNGGKFFEMYLEVNKILTKKLHQAGVLLLLGTDTPAITVAVVPGYSIHEELRILTECGLSPFEALKTGTANAGIAEKAMTGTNNIGTIEVGKQADFILTAKNPLENVANIREMAGVMLQGKWLARAELEALKVTVRENLADALAEVIRNNGGVEAIVKKYNEIKRAASNEHYILPDPLNNLGYNLLGENKIAEAITVFKINVQEFPDYWGWYDSLAEAYIQAGDKELAIENYEKSLRLNPNNKAAMAALQILKKREK